MVPGGGEVGVVEEVEVVEEVVDEVEVEEGSSPAPSSWAMSRA